MYDYISYGMSDYDDYDTYSSYDYNSNPYYSKSNKNTDLNSSLVTAILGMGLVAWLITIALIVLTFVGVWKAFSKAGHAGWESLIGGHDEFVRFQDAGIKGYWIFLLFVPIANIIIPFWLNIEYAKAFGKSAGFGIGLTLLPFIFFPILGLGNAQYVGPAYNENTNSYNQYNQNQYTNNMNNNSFNQNNMNNNNQPDQNVSNDNDANNTPNDNNNNL